MEEFKRLIKRQRKMSQKSANKKSQKKAQNSKEKHLLLCDATDCYIKGDLNNSEVASKEKDKERKAEMKTKKKKVLGIESGCSDSVNEMNHSTKRKNLNKISRNKLNSKCDVESIALHSFEYSSMTTNRRSETSVKNDIISGKNEVTLCLDSHFMKHKKQKQCMSCDVIDGIEGTGDTVSHSVESEESSNGMLEEQRAAEDGSCQSVTKSNAGTSNDQLVEFRSYNTSLGRFWKKKCLELESEGKKFNSGRFSTEEDQQLKKNWKRIIKNCPFEPPQVLLFRDIYREKRKLYHVSRHIKETNFYIRLGKHINRPLSASFYRARKLFHPAQLKGRFSPEEDAFLLKMVLQYGTHWYRIGHIMDIRDYILAGHFRTLKSNYNRGRWTEEEDRQLIAAIKSKVPDCNDSKAFVNFPWTEIAQMVPTRYSTQCLCRWVQVLAFGKAGKQRFSNRHKKRLIHEIKKQKVNHECDIDWIELTSKFSTASPQFLENRFRSLKSMMPSYQLHSLDDILDYIEKWLLSHKSFKSKGLELASTFE